MADIEKPSQRKRINNDYETELDTSKPRKIPRTLTEKNSEKRLIVILENASLETVKVPAIKLLSMLVKRP